MIMHHIFTPLPMPQEVIDHVNRLRALDKQQELLTFFDWLGQSESFEPLLSRNIGAALPNLPSLPDFSHPSSNYSKQNDTRVYSELAG